MDQRLLDYIKKARVSGMDDVEIKQSLLGSGYPIEVINDVFSYLELLEIASPDSNTQPPKWLRISFKVWAVLGFLFVVGSVAFSLFLLNQFFSVSNFVTLVKSLAPFSYVILVLAALFFIAFTIYSYGLFKLRKWVIPLLILSSFISLVQLIVALLKHSFGLSVIISPLVNILFTYKAWTYRRTFTGSYKNPILFTIVIVTTLPLLFYLLLPFLPSGIPYVSQLQKFSLDSYGRNKNDLQQPLVNVTPSVKILNDFENWQTYRNDKYGFEFKYPADWKIIDERRLDDLTVLSIRLSSPEDYNVDQNQETLSFRITAYSYNDWIDSINLFPNIKYQDIAFAGISAKKSIYRPTLKSSPGRLVYRLSLYYNGMAFDFSSGNGSLMDETVRINEVDQILSTFRFMTNVDSDKKDSDNDGLSDIDEAKYGTDPHKADTDGDGYPDGEEVQNGYNPLGPGRLNMLPTISPTPSINKAFIQPNP